MYSLRISVYSFIAACLQAAPSCPAGMPLGSIELTVKRGDNGPALPIAKVNRLEEGDEIHYAPSLKPKEKRDGDIALVLVASNQNNDFAILDAKDAAKPAKWMVPFRTSLAMYVYGPSGLSIRKAAGRPRKRQRTDRAACRVRREDLADRIGASSDCAV